MSNVGILSISSLGGLAVRWTPFSLSVVWTRGKGGLLWILHEIHLKASVRPTATGAMNMGSTASYCQPAALGPPNIFCMMPNGIRRTHRLSKNGIEMYFLFVFLLTSLKRRSRQRCSEVVKAHGPWIHVLSVLSLASFFAASHISTRVEPDESDCSGLERLIMMADVILDCVFSSS